MNAPGSPPLPSRPDILVLEDDPDLVRLFESAVRKVDVAARIIFAREAGQIIDLLAGRFEGADRGPSPLPRLILLDLDRQRETGIEVLRWLRGPSPSLRPITLALFASAADPDITRAYEWGAHSCLVKPGTSESLGELIRFVAEYWLVFNLGPGDRA